MRSILTAFRARVYSLARSKGWCVGSRFRGCLSAASPGAADGRLKVFILMTERLSLCHGGDGDRQRKGSRLGLLLVVGERFWGWPSLGGAILPALRLKV